MRLLASLLCAGWLWGGDFSFHVAGDEAASWAKALAAGGFQPAESSARLIVVSGARRGSLIFRAIASLTILRMTLATLSLR